MSNMPLTGNHLSFEFWAAEVLAESFSQQNPEADCRFIVCRDESSITVTGWTTADFMSDDGASSEALHLRIAAHWGDEHPLAKLPVDWQVRVLSTRPESEPMNFRTCVTCRKTDGPHVVVELPANMADIIGRSVNAMERLVHVFTRYIASSLIELGIGQSAEVQAEGGSADRCIKLLSLKLTGTRRRLHQELVGRQYSFDDVRRDLCPQRLSLPFAIENDRFGDTPHFGREWHQRPYFCYYNYFQKIEKESLPEPPYDVECQYDDLVDYVTHLQLDGHSVEDFICGEYVEDFSVCYQDDAGCIHRVSSQGPASDELIERCNHDTPVFMEELPLVHINPEKLSRIRAREADASILTKAEKKDILELMRTAVALACYYGDTTFLCYPAKYVLPDPNPTSGEDRKVTFEESLLARDFRFVSRPDIREIQSEMDRYRQALGAELPEWCRYLPRPQLKGLLDLAEAQKHRLPAHPVSVAVCRAFAEFEPCKNSTQPLEILRDVSSIEAVIASLAETSFAEVASRLVRGSSTYVSGMHLTHLLGEYKKQFGEPAPSWMDFFNCRARAGVQLLTEAIENNRRLPVAGHFGA